MKYDDLLYLTEGLRREVVDKAIAIHNISASDAGGFSQIDTSDFSQPREAPA